MAYISFNPAYALKPDTGRTLILASLVGRRTLGDMDDSFTNIIHPIYAMILSHIDGRDYLRQLLQPQQRLRIVLGVNSIKRPK